MAHRISFACYLLTFLVPVIAWKANHGVLGDLDRVAQALAWGRLFGLLGAVGLLWQLLLISRVKVLEQRFGLDRLTQYHHLQAFIVVGCLLLHGPLVTWGHAQNSFATMPEQVADFWKTWIGLRGAIVGQALLLTLVLFSWQPLRRRVSYERWYGFHLLGYLGILLAFSHQVAQGKEFVDHSGMTNYWYGFHALVVLLLLGRRFFIPGYYLWQHRFRVERIVPEAGDATSVFISGRNLSSFPAIGGQFVRVRFWASGFRWEVHPFSLSAPPNGQELRLTIKKLGDFTRKIPDLPLGTTVLVDGPHGIFTARRAMKTKVLLIAAGIGITPIRAIFEDLLTAGKDVVLLYCNRNERGIALRQELERIAEGKARIVHILSDDPDWQGEKGHLDEEKLRTLVQDLAERDVFQCGPPPMMLKLRTALGHMGVLQENIFDESFSL